jgi:CheY-like chemotaxis protein
MSAQPLAGLSILLVEDDPDGREVLEIFLTHVGATVRSAATAVEALALFKAAPPGIVVTDIIMPGRDGVWLLEQMRALPGIPRVPAIALTGRALRADVDRLRAAGFDANLVKPVDLDDIAVVIAQIAARRSP